MNRVIKAPLRIIRGIAKQTLKSGYFQAVLFCLATALIMHLPSEIVSRFPQSTFTTVLSYIVYFYDLIIPAPLILSMAFYFLKLFRGEGCEVNLNSLQKGFDYFPKALMLYVRVMIFTWLWSLLFVIPGIYAFLRYSQSFFLLADNPSKSPVQCMNESCFIMRANNFKFFKLLLSFLPLVIFALAPKYAAIRLLEGDTISEAMSLLNIYAEQVEAAGAVGSAVGATAESYLLQAQSLINDVIKNPVITVLGFMLSLAIPFILTSHACFFDVLAGKLVIQAEAEEDSAPSDAQNA